jgi:beta-N-acetylhexosaminidase
MVTAHPAVDDAIGQCFMVGFDGLEPTPELVALIERDRVGGVILFTRNCRDAAQILALTTKLQAIARAAEHPAPLLIAIDQENGLVRRLGPDATPLPGNMALGAADSAELTAAVAEATGRELRALGITMNLAPVADVNNNPANPVIGVRAFGGDPALVARHVVAAVGGYARAGMIATLKHFPGHGDTAADSHLGLPVVPDDLERLRAVELPPFRAGIAAGTECMLLAHVALPRLTAGRPVPATLAPEIVQRLLREELGFEGVAMTDCLEMGAIADGIGVAPGAVAALRAGSDLVLVSHRADRQREALAAVREEAAADAALRHSLLESAGRLLKLKRRLACETLPTAADLAVVGSPAHRALSASAYGWTITLVRDEHGLLPLHSEQEAGVAVVAFDRGPLSVAVDLPYAPQMVARAVRRHHPQGVVEVILAPDQPADDRERAREVIEAADVVLLVTLNAHRDAAQRAAFRAAIAGAQRVIGLAVGDPYDAAALPEVGTYLAAYEYGELALRAAADVIFGHAQPLGHLPVALGRGE